MKKCRLTAAMLALFLLTACGQSRPAETTEQKVETPPVSSENTQTAPDAATEPAAGNLPDRPADMELTFLLEGMEETVPATVYEGQGWSLYIPNEGWRLDECDRDDGVFQTAWESTSNDDAELWVLSMGQRTLAEAQRWLKAEEDDFVFREDKQGGLWGSDARDHELMEVRFHSGADALYAVVWTYPEAAVEGFGTRLSVIADTFEITES